MIRVSALARGLGSVVFVAAGSWFLMFPPRVTDDYYQGAWPVIVWGVVLVTGGLISGAAVIWRLPQVERYGVLLVIVASLMIAGSQYLTLIAGAPPTVGGQALTYTAYSAWAFDRYVQMGDRAQMIADFAERQERETEREA